MAHLESTAFRNARTLLYLILFASLAGVLRRTYDVAFNVDTSRVGLLILYVGFPLLQTALTALALALIRLRRLTGAVLGAALIGYVGLRIATGGASSSGMIGNMTIVLGIVVGVGVIWIAVRLCFEAVSWSTPSDAETSPSAEPQS